MDESTQNLDLHLTLLFQWLVRTVGAALAWLFGGALLGGVAGVLLNDAQPPLGALAFLVGTLLGGGGFVMTLWSADAPMPFDVREPGE